MDTLELIRNELKDSKDDLRIHIEDDQEFKKETGLNIKTIQSDISTIKENHLAHIQVAMERTSANVDWLMKYHWIIAGASISGLIAGIINILK